LECALHLLANIAFFIYFLFNATNVIMDKEKVK
jgi:hypothetical protein